MSNGVPDLLDPLRFSPQGRVGRRPSPDDGAGRAAAGCLKNAM
jgi:hypothetical protein